MFRTTRGTGDSPGGRCTKDHDETRRRHRRRRIGIAAAALTAAPVLAATPVAAEEPPVTPVTDGAVIWEWNKTAMDVLTPSTRPLLTQPFVIAAMHVAMYDAVMAIERTAEPFGTALTAPAGASAEAAAATAAHRVLVGFLPGSAAVFDAALATSLDAIPDGPAETDGIAIGEAAGWGTLAYRLGDGSQSGPLPPSLPAGPGVWQPTPPATSGLAPWLAYAAPFTMRTPDQFRPAPPPAIDSGRFRRALDEVRRLGSATSTERTAEQTVVARFWGDQPIAQGQRTLRAKAQALGWDLAGTARFFAAVMTSQADAIIACWDAKYTYQFWRPWQSVPVAEPGWTPLLPTPNHPEFPSAHGCVTGSMAFAMAEVMGTQQIDLDVDALNINVSRHYATLDDLLDELGEARILAGLHYRFSTETGIRLAERVVAFNLRRNFRPG
ncbi:MAG TPA: vanadium-dependent haloperoxidase [Ilumatobacteraceae bacterium]|nr:vanadium-dependent haloperoxidase [Ilumatobacteraceae bacterium]